MEIENLLKQWDGGLKNKYRLNNFDYVAISREFLSPPFDFGGVRNKVWRARFYICTDKLIEGKLMT